MVFPEGFEVLRFRRTPGWNFEVERDAAGKITGVMWSGSKIGREEYEQFSFMARAANPGTFKLDAYQTYEGGEVVGWVNPAEPQPAPHVTIVAAASEAPAGTGGDPFAGGAAAPAASTAVSPGRQPGTTLAVVSLVVALASLVAAVTARRRART